MKKLVKKLMATLFIAGLAVGSLTGCGNSGSNSALILGVSQFNEVFSPFYYTTAFDKDVWEQVNAYLIQSDREGSPVDGLANYEIEEIKNDAGEIVNTVYRFTLKEEAKFSDGTPVTADDLIFNIKVYCDPTYTGMATLYTTPIVGVKEYRYDDPNYSAKINEITEASQSISDDEIKAYIEKCAKNDFETYGAEAVNGASGFTNPDGLTGDSLVEAEIKAYAEFEIANSFESYLEGAIEDKYKTLEQEYIQSNLSTGEIKVPEIEGVKKIDDRTVEVTIEGVDPKAIWNFSFPVTPYSYYGVGEDGTTFSKGNLSMVEEKSAKPVGAGPYVFEKFENNVVTLRANEHYYLGAPKVPTLKIQVTSGANKIDGVIAGDMDISDPNATMEAIKQVEEAGLHYELIDNLGYGYIGINAERVPDINVRKGLMSLMNREPAIETYYGELASVIERPMSMVSWAYPEGAEAVYPFSPEKALEYFKAAGYEQVNGQLVKDGKQLKIEVGIGGEGTMDHPSAPILTQMKAEMEKMGAVLEINDCDTNILFDRLNSHSWDMWVAAWSADMDPDMYQVYSSKGPSNHYRIKNKELDKLIMDARSTTDIEERKAYYAKALDIIMDEAVEMPVYQRKNMYIYNPAIVNIDTLPKDMTPYYGFPCEYTVDGVNVELVK